MYLYFALKTCSILAQKDKIGVKLPRLYIYNLSSIPSTTYSLQSTIHSRHWALLLWCKIPIRKIKINVYYFLLKIFLTYVSSVFLGEKRSQVSQIPKWKKNLVPLLPPSLPIIRKDNAVIKFWQFKTYTELSYFHSNSAFSGWIIISLSLFDKSSLAVRFYFCVLKHNFLLNNRNVSF